MQTSDYLSSNTRKTFSFLVYLIWQPKYKNIFFRFLVQMKTLKFASKIYWPLYQRLIITLFGLGIVWPWPCPCFLVGFWSSQRLFITTNLLTRSTTNHRLVVRSSPLGLLLITQVPTYFTRLWILYHLLSTWFLKCFQYKAHCAKV